jgi:hypothetical protein
MVKERVVAGDGNTQLNLLRTLFDTGIGKVRDLAEAKALIAKIKEYFSRHQILKEREATVNHGTGSVTVVIDFRGVDVNQDSEGKFHLHIPARPKDG